MLRILADENFPGPAIVLLRGRGRDVVSVKETMRGSSDPEILRRAQVERRLIVTFDKDFGELAYRFGLPAWCGVILFRLTGTSPEADNYRIVEVLESRSDWTGQFASVTDVKMRIRPLPAKR